MGTERADGVCSLGPRPREGPPGPSLTPDSSLRDEEETSGFSCLVCGALSRPPRAPRSAPVAGPECWQGPRTVDARDRSRRPAGSRVACRPGGGPPLPRRLGRVCGVSPKIVCVPS